MSKKDKRLWIDGCLGSELKDTQGETLSVEGADISELENGKGRWNDNHGKGFFNSLGRITEAKKILKAEDCENERHKYYWEKIKAPYIYGIGFLYNDEDHPNARAAAAILRNIHREDSPLKVRASVEGGVLARGISDPTRLARTKIHSCAITFTPANNATLLEPLNLDKTDMDWETDKQLIKSVMHLAETNVPSFRHIERHASANTIHDNILKIQELAKSLGVEIEVKNSTPEIIMKNAVYHKLNDNVNRINNLVKAISAKNMQSMMAPKKEVNTEVNAAPAQPVNTAVAKPLGATAERKITASDKYQQGIGRLKAESTTPARPVDTASSPTDAMKVKSATDVAKQNVFKQHASKAMRDPQHLNSVIEGLKSRGADQAKIDQVLSRIKSHMAKGEDDIEKGDISRAAKNLVIAGAMGMGAHYADKQPAKQAINKPREEQSRSIASTPESKSSMTFKGPEKEYFQNLADKQKARADKTKAKYSKLKKGLTKALMAGYGGSGSPMNLTGGGVFQAESLEDGRDSQKSEQSDGIQYVSCDNCGHEQVYMKHQVKCRSCNKNFSLDKLKNHM